MTTRTIWRIDWRSGNVPIDAEADTEAEAERLKVKLERAGHEVHIYPRVVEGNR